MLGVGGGPGFNWRELDLRGAACHCSSTEGRVT